MNTTLQKYHSHKMYDDKIEAGTSIFIYIPFQMVCHTSSGLKGKLKSSCGAGRLRSFVHFLERNLQETSIVMKGPTSSDLCSLDS